MITERIFASIAGRYHGSRLFILAWFARRVLGYSCNCKRDCLEHRYSTRETRFCPRTDSGTLRWDYWQSQTLRLSHIQGHCQWRAVWTSCGDLATGPWVSVLNTIWNGFLLGLLLNAAHAQLNIQNYLFTNRRMSVSGFEIRGLQTGPAKI